jgi:hypothetical protein
VSDTSQTTAPTTNSPLLTEADLDLLKHIASSNRNLHEARKTREYSIVLATFTFYVLSVAASFYEPIDLPDDNEMFLFCLWFTYIFLGRLAYLDIKTGGLANEVNQNTAHWAEDSIIKHLEGKNLPTLKQYLEKKSTFQKQPRRHAWLWQCLVILGGAVVSAIVITTPFLAPQWPSTLFAAIAAILGALAATILSSYDLINCVGERLLRPPPKPNSNQNSPTTEVLPMSDGQKNMSERDFAWSIYQHSDHLQHQRHYYFATIQAFLFIAAGLGGSTTEGTNTLPQLPQLLLLLSLFGVTLSIVWWAATVRLEHPQRALIRRHLEHDPVYNIYHTSLWHLLPGGILINNLPPISTLLIWAYVFATSLDWVRLDKAQLLMLFPLALFFAVILHFAEYACSWYFLERRGLNKFVQTNHSTHPPDAA